MAHKKRRRKRRQAIYLPEEGHSGKQETFLLPVVENSMCTQSVSCNCYNCTFNINLAPIDIFEGKEANNSQDIKKCLINLSKETLSPELVQLMGKGLTFIPKPKRNRTIQFIQQIDDFCRKLSTMYVFRYSDRAQPNLYRKSGYDPGPTDCRVVEHLTTTVKRILLPL